MMTTRQGFSGTKLWIFLWYSPVIQPKRQSINEESSVIIECIAVEIKIGYLRETGSWDSSMNIRTGYGLDSSGSISGSARFFSSPQRSDRLCGPPSLPSNATRGLFPQEYRIQGVKLTTPLHLVPRLRMVEL
jgi:hypothetical protein